MSRGELAWAVTHWPGGRERRLSLCPAPAGPGTPGGPAPQDSAPTLENKLVEAEDLLKAPSSSDVVGFLCNPGASALGIGFIPKRCLFEPACSSSAPWWGLGTGPLPLSLPPLPGASPGRATPGYSLGGQFEALPG